MGYLIDTTIIRQHTTIIPSADAIILDSTPYEVFPAVADTFIYPLSVNLLVEKNSTNTYLSYNVIELINGTTLNEIATCRESRSILEYGYAVNLCMNNNFPPFDPGCTIKVGVPLFLKFRLPITAGDGDIKVIINYTSIPFL
jgi:hypothetical protein